MTSIIGFLKEMCGDPAKGEFKMPESFDALVDLLHQFVETEHKPLTQQIVELVGESAEARAIWNYVNMRRLLRCKMVDMPSSEAKIATGVRSGSNAHLLSYLERYMDEHPEEFGTIKIEGNGEAR